MGLHHSDEKAGINKWGWCFRGLVTVSLPSHCCNEGFLDVHACLLLLHLLKAAWLCLATVIMVCKIQIRGPVDPCRAHFIHCSLPFLPQSQWFPAANTSQEVQPEHWGCHNKATPPAWEHSCCEAAMKNFTRQAQSWHKPATHKWRLNTASPASAYQCLQRSSLSFLWFLDITICPLPTENTGDWSPALCH